MKLRKRTPETVALRCNRWNRERAEETALKAGIDSGYRDGARDGERKGHQRCMEERTRFLVPATRADGARRDPLLLSPVPEQDYVRIALCDNAPVTLDDLYNRRTARDWLPYPTVVTFRAVKKCWDDNRGNRVYWYDWEVCR